MLAAGTDPRAAARAYAQAVVFDANDVDSWTGLARALLAIKPDQGSERYDLPVNASGAALIAYERAQTPAAKAAALWVLHEALKRRSYWRPAIDALKASLTLAEDAAGARSLRRAGGRARLPHRRVQGRGRGGPAAPVHPVLRAPGARARSTGRSTSRWTARTRRRSPPRRARSASTASPTASATRCRCARACRPRSARSWPRRPSSPST